MKDLFRSLTIVLAAALAAIFLPACGKKEEPVTSSRLEEMRQTAKANAEYNAALYKAQNPRFTSDFSIISRSDDAQSSACPQGDGWAELSIMKVEGKTVDKTVLMCSTFSASVGCYRKDDFDKAPNLAKQNGGCNSEVPYPLPRIAK
jgi:long-subunit fatty acid transport protein